MLIVHVDVRVRPERAADFPGRHAGQRAGVAGRAGRAAVRCAAWRDTVAEMMAEPRQSARYSAVFPAAGQGWVSGSP